MPESVIRYLHGELSTLSAKATAWVLPSYLRHVVAHEDEDDPLPTEFLIYDLASDGDHVAEVQARLSFLSDRQIEVLVAIVEHLASDRSGMTIARPTSSERRRSSARSSNRRAVEQQRVEAGDDPGIVRSAHEPSLWAPPQLSRCCSDSFVIEAHTA